MFRSCNNQLYIHNQPLHIKGCSFFGLETPDKCLHGLWSHSLTHYLDFLASQSFNALRIPFSLDIALHDGEPKTIDYSKNADLLGKTSLQILDKLVAEAGKRGMLVMLDLHHLAADKGITPLWYSSEYNEAQVIQGLQNMARRYSTCWNVFAFDIKNEPHGPASWDTKEIAHDWRAAAQRLGNAVLQVAPHLLIFVEGVQHCNHPFPEDTFWGGHFGDLQKLQKLHKTQPLQLDVPERLVYSPHVYGPSVHMQPWFSEGGFPRNMPAVWERQWGFLADRSSGPDAPAVVLGEWGGRAVAGTPDRVWSDAFAAYLQQKGLDVGFYWCLNPNSGDTGGLLLDDWTTPDEYKLQLLAKITPNPTKIQPPHT